MRFCRNPQCVQARIGWMQANAFGYCSYAFECDEVKHKKRARPKCASMGLDTVIQQCQRPLMQLGSEPRARIPFKIMEIVNTERFRHGFILP